MRSTKATLGIVAILAAGATLSLGCAPPYRPVADVPAPATPDPTHTTGVFVGAGGVKLFEQAWHPAGPARAVVVIHHGLKSHSAEYAEFAKHLTAQGDAVYAYDMRGHGRSEGPRASLDDFEDLVEDLAIFMRSVQAREPGRPVFLVGHSLGSSILMDVIVELHRLLMEGGLDESSWNRLRCFVSYGTALEKTHYLLSCARPVAPQQVGEFKADLYSRLFSADETALRPAGATSRPPMFWTNYWYFSDVVANAIASYGRARSTADPAPDPSVHYTCLNARLPSPAGVVWSHGSYLGDRSLWHSAGDRRGLASIVASA